MKKLSETSTGKSHETSVEESSCCLDHDFSQILHQNLITDGTISLLTFHDLQQMGMILPENSEIHNIYCKCLEFDNAFLTFLNGDTETRVNASSTRV